MSRKKSVYVDLDEITKNLDKEIEHDLAIRAAAPKIKKRPLGEMRRGDPGANFLVRQLDKMWAEDLRLENLK